MWKLTAALSTTALLMTGAALAGEHGDMTTAEKFAKMDADSDGVVTETEFLIAWDEKVAMKQAAGEWMDKTDTELVEKGTAYFEEIAGDDGELTLAELEAHEAMQMQKEMSEQEDS